jgi:hypothetical protein
LPTSSHRIGKRAWQFLAVCGAIAAVAISAIALTTASKRHEVSDDASTIRSLCGTVNYDLNLGQTSNLAFSPDF